MDKFRKQLKDFENSIKRFRESIKLAKKKRNTELYSFLRDSSIQRFEFTFEIFWKLIKTAIKELEGIECNSPKSCFRELFKNKYIDQKKLIKLFEMVDSRNLTVHTYSEELADELFKKLRIYKKLLSKTSYL
ncbi:MAG: HI0074 family nucleotidyltransferase substrate-binding subunit [bacterium]|jgi:nucleotidyltransferase substrate binding protein (TIGR01987 family)